MKTLIVLLATTLSQLTIAKGNMYEKYKWTGFDTIDNQLKPSDSARYDFVPHHTERATMAEFIKLKTWENLDVIYDGKVRSPEIMDEILRLNVFPGVIREDISQIKLRDLNVISDSDLIELQDNMVMLPIAVSLQYVAGTIAQGTIDAQMMLKLQLSQNNDVISASVIDSDKADMYCDSWLVEGVGRVLGCKDPFDLRAAKMMVDLYMNKHFKGATEIKNSKGEKVLKLEDTKKAAERQAEFKEVLEFIKRYMNQKR